MRTATHGGIKVTTIGATEATSEVERALERFEDSDLVFALGMRGYDVTVRQPKATVLAKRQAEHSRRVAEKAKETDRG